ncbi:MAG: LysR family transcriptional regulator [Kandleria vitulina]|nr:LysR family transcriptional regulator [Kandleria vitulina]MEE0988142.1 LysR family transcriptional regulator [Kandleria vitulina]
MEIKNLKYFLAVAREENMSRAAEQLHVSQPTLSKTLKALEEEAVYQAQLQYFTQ